MLRALLKNYRPTEFYAWYGHVPKQTISVEEKKLFDITSRTSNSEACTFLDPPSPAEDKRKES